eukprot:SAG11_NODE_8765_length_978_cov_5.749716_1_plen_166_part_10
MQNGNGFNQNQFAGNGSNSFNGNMTPMGRGFPVPAWQSNGQNGSSPFAQGGGQHNGPPSQRRQVNCYSCGNIGHYASDASCPNFHRRMSRPNAPNAGATANQMDVPTAVSIALLSTQQQLMSTIADSRPDTTTPRMAGAARPPTRCSTTPLPLAQGQGGGLTKIQA